MVGIKFCLSASRSESPRVVFALPPPDSTIAPFLYTNCNPPYGNSLQSSSKYFEVINPIALWWVSNSVFLRADQNLRGLCSLCTEMNKPARGVEFLPQTSESDATRSICTGIEVVQVFRTSEQFADTRSGDRFEIDASSLPGDAPRSLRNYTPTRTQNVGIPQSCLKYVSRYLGPSGDSG